MPELCDILKGEGIMVDITQCFLSNQVVILLVTEINNLIYIYIYIYIYIEREREREREREIERERANHFYIIHAIHTFRKCLT